MWKPALEKYIEMIKKNRNKTTVTCPSFAWSSAARHSPFLSSNGSRGSITRKNTHQFVGKEVICSQWARTWKPEMTN